MKIYIVRVEPEEGGGFISWVGTDEEEAFGKVFACSYDQNFITIWENGKELSEYYRFTMDQIRFTKWERNSGAIIPRLETENDNSGTA